MRKYQIARWWCWHQWNSVRDTGANIYSICSRCSGRRIQQRSAAAIDNVWLYTGQWKELVFPELPVQPGVVPNKNWVLNDWRWIGGDPKNYPPGVEMADIMAARLFKYNDPNPRCDYAGNLIGPGEKAWNE